MAALGTRTSTWPQQRELATPVQLSRLGPASTALRNSLCQCMQPHQLHSPARPPCWRFSQHTPRAHTSAMPGPPSDDGSGKQLAADNAASFWPALYKFSRPHTMLGTFVSVTSISLLAIQSHLPAPVDTVTALISFAYALVSALLMNIAIVGINQLTDVAIDKVNKPYLPLASGEFSMRTGLTIVCSTAILSLLLGVASGSTPLMLTLSISLALGIVYSVELPFMRWKRSPVLAASCILAIRAVAVQMGFFFHMQGSLISGAAAAAAAAPLTLTASLVFTVSFMLLFSIVIALFKDIPDVRGDNVAGVRTLTVRLGVPRVFWSCIWILTAAYAGAVIYSVLAAHFAAAATTSTIPFFNQLATSAAAAHAGGHTAGHVSGSLLGSAMPASVSLLGTGGGSLGMRALACVAGHCLLAGLLWQRALNTDLNSTADITGCYMHVWKLFYAEYLIIPLLL